MGLAITVKVSTASGPIEGVRFDRPGRFRHHAINGWTLVSKAEEKEKRRELEAAAKAGPVTPVGKKKPAAKPAAPAPAAAPAKKPAGRK